MMLQGTESDLSTILREIVDMYPNIHNMIKCLKELNDLSTKAFKTGIVNKDVKTNLRIGTVLVVITELALMSIYKDFEIDMGRLLRSLTQQGTRV